MAHGAQITIDHDEIQNWAEARGGRPAIVAATESGGSGLLRIDLGEANESLKEISWEDFFKIFDDNDLAFLYQDEGEDGEQSLFSKFVSRSEHRDELRGEANPDTGAADEDAPDEEEPEGDENGESTDE